MSYSVLFVCLGNICRSPMAEAVFRDKAGKAGLRDLTIDSAGTGDWHIGKPPHAGTRGVLDTNRISYEGMRARQLKREDGEKFDLIVAMDTNNERDIRSVIGSDSRAKVIRFLSLVPEKGLDDVPDPYYTGNFDEVFEMVGEGCDRLIDRIVDRKQ
ncbi:low molecular weight protein-tyrosine-phosphatase [Cohnella sp. AR92]|uniref:low molecular weight protein-tyrosine-phosphatase n=1 Tax=Cohnella sp. AR92 TaxID=648716 RepID=UPI000F8F7A74|nr:low molecular weight protein-tyrosine-phosphatase [Cohnella sp. AR92]RUS46841.1 low molecular weight phosphotyrosine protein phosphatase [Cohnella sp. AR92]